MAAGQQVARYSLMFRSSVRFGSASSGPLSLVFMVVAPLILNVLCIAAMQSRPSDERLNDSAKGGSRPTVFDSRGASNQDFFEAET